jgi:hypothetical protein
MRNALILMTGSMVLFLAGCASDQGVANQGNIEITAASNGQAVPGAQCAVNTASQRWEVSTPTVVPVGAPNGDLRVVCKKPGYRDSEVLYRPQPYSYAGSPNVGLGVGGGSGGGGVGVGFGFNFPIGGAAGPVGGYPTRIAVEMTPQ